MLRSTLISCLLMLGGAGLLAAPSLAEGCLDCHSKPAEDGSHKPLVDTDAWAGSVHASQECTLCHHARDAKGFEAIPHRLDPEGAPDCLACHDDDFEEFIADFGRSVHATEMETFTCARCHDVHTIVKNPSEMEREARVRMANRPCIACHRESVVRASGREGAKGVREAHAWIPRPEAHAKMRCVVCHTPIDGSEVHDVRPREESIRSCDACHDVSAPLIAKYLGADDRSSWVTNPLVFEHAYMPGATRNRVVDGIILGLFGLTVVGVLGHALLRLATARRRPAVSDIAETVEFYPFWLRLWHWTNALLFLALAVTGIRLHFGGQRGPVLSFETAFNVHNLAGALLVVVGVWVLLANAVSGNQRQYLSAPEKGLKGILLQARYYLWGIFRGEDHPFHATKARKFNPLQQVTYASVMYGVYPLLLLSGALLLFPDILPTGVLGHPGAWWVAALHWVLAAAAILFLLGHLYLGSMGDKVRDLYLSMIDGYHRTRRRQ